MQVEVVGVKFKTSNTIYNFSPSYCSVKVGDYCIVETDRGSEMGMVVRDKKVINAEELTAPLRNILSVATPEMVKKAQIYSKNAELLKPKIVKIIRSFGLDMKVVKVDASYDNTRILIYFSAENRVDFRELVKKLAEELKSRIELRQIGARDEVRMIGGLGPCGKVCCCVESFGEYDHVSMKMAKNQNLSLNPTSVSGLCGKLMCCLAYENSMYTEAMKEMPSVGSRVKTPDGMGEVVYNNLMKRAVDVKFSKGDESEIKTYDLAKIKFEKKNDDKK